METKLPAKDRIECLTKRIDALNHNHELDIHTRLEEIDRARRALKIAERDLARGG